MSYSTCITCLAVVRDHDDVTGTPEQPLGLPSHGCARPVGLDIWNNGFNYWDDNTMQYRACTDDGEPVSVWHGPPRPTA